MRNFGRSWHADLTQEATGVSSFSDLESTDFSYHAHIKGGQGYGPNLNDRRQLAEMSG